MSADYPGKFMLSLSEKSYLADKIARHWPDLSGRSYEVASAFTPLQRNKFLNHLFKREDVEAKEMLDQIITQQISIK